MSAFSPSHSLSSAEIGRFSRQLLVDEIGVRGQERLRDASALVVGVGGLGCPVAAYLAAAGIGRLGLVDADRVASDNLHRQLLHGEARVGERKTESANDALHRLNANVRVETFPVFLTRDNAIEIVSRFDVIADCSDNVPTRYLVNDACVVVGKPLVSGSALRWEGQLSVYNHGKECPCYRCLFPQPPAPEMVTSCAEGGVVGPVVGVIGAMQAIEVIKLTVGLPSSFAGAMFLFDGLSGRTRRIRLRERRRDCAICSSTESITQLPQDYERFCGSRACDQMMQGFFEVRTICVLSEGDRISPTDYATLRGSSSTAPMLIDVRSANEFAIAHLPEAINIPLNEMKKWTENEIRHLFNDSLAIANEINVFVVCHRGNDSQLAVALLREKLTSDSSSSWSASTRVHVRDLEGGLEQWAELVDRDFPRY